MAHLQSHEQHISVQISITILFIFVLFFPDYCLADDRNIWLEYGSSILQLAKFKIANERLNDKSLISALNLYIIISIESIHHLRTDTVIPIAWTNKWQIYTPTASPTSPLHKNISRWGRFASLLDENALIACMWMRAPDIVHHLLWSVWTRPNRQWDYPCQAESLVRHLGDRKTSIRSDSCILPGKSEAKQPSFSANSPFTSFTLRAYNGRTDGHTHTQYFTQSFIRWK